MALKKVDYKRFWKAHDCEHCINYAGITKGCKLGEENCFLEAEKKQRKSVCDGCMYGRITPCIGSCAVINLIEMRIRKERARA